MTAVHYHSLFQPHFLGCPICNQDKSGRSAFARVAHEVLPNGLYKGHSCGHEFTLYDAVRRDFKGNFGIIGAFARYHLTSKQTLESGKVAAIPLGIPSGMAPIATYLTPSSSKEHPRLHVNPTSLGIQDDKLFVSLPASLNSPTESLGAPIEVTVAVFLHDAVGLPGWKSLLFNSLTDYAERRYSLAVFKLATSIEICADVCFERYLASQGIGGNLQRLIVSSSRSWDSRARRTQEVAAALLDEAECTIFRSALGPFKQRVRAPRNDFAHTQPVPLDYDAVDAAYEASFDILWTLGRLSDELDTRRS